MLMSIKKSALNAGIDSFVNGLKWFVSFRYFWFLWLSSALSAVWLDLRTQSTVERLINKTPGNNKNHLKVSELDQKSFISF